MPTMRSSSSAGGYGRGGSSHRVRPQDQHQERYNDFSDDNDDPMVLNDPSFDILEWHPALQSCQRYFLDHAQHEPATQAVCALINIRLPFQNVEHPITSSTQQASLATSPSQHYYYPPQRSSPNSPGAGGGSGNLSPFAHHNLTTTTTHQSPNQTRPGGGGPGSSSSSSHHLPSHHHQQQQAAQYQHSHQHHPQPPSNPSPTPPPPIFISLIPYIRRLVVTNFDNPAILHGFFGDDWSTGILPHVQCERRNYLFAAKHGGWRSCKKQYDAGSGFGSHAAAADESVPFLKPLSDAREDELAAAERAWSDWLAMEDWMVGPDAPGRRPSSAGAAPGGRRGGGGGGAGGRGEERG